MKKTIWEKHIPTLLGILIITVGIATTSFLVKNGIIFIGRATPTQTPQNIRITNISDTSFSVSYTTEANVLGSIPFGTDKNLKNTSLDDRDQQSGSITPYKIHHITIRNLNASTKYFFSITSGQTTFLNNSDLFEVATGPSIETSPPEQQPIAGKVVFPDGTNLSEAIVYVTATNAQTISTIVKSNGNYILPLNSMRTDDLTSYALLSKDTALKMLIIGDSQQSNITLLAKQINPVPTIILSKDYDFTIGPNPSASQSASPSFPSSSASPVSGKEPKILTPEKNEAFKDEQPLFKGIASPGANVKIIIHSEDQIQTEVQADKNGNWVFRPQTPLSPGEHMISIVAQDKFGVFKTLTQTFTVYAAGTQISGSQVISPTPTLAPTPNLTPSVTSTPSPTQTPTPTPSPTTIPKPTLGLSPPGNSAIFPLGITAIATTVIGIFLFLATRGSTSL